MPTEESHETAGGQSGDPREELIGIGVDRLVAPRLEADPRWTGQTARRVWPMAPLPEPVAPAEPAFDALFHSGAEDAAGPLHE